MQRFCDLHCHILYGVDDGAQTIEESRALIDTAYATGTRTICFTPHYNPLRELESAGAEETFRTLSEEMKEKYPDLTLCLGAEILYHQRIADSIRRGACRTMNGTRFVLVEFLPEDDGRYIVQSLESISAGGYTPILAHADRYKSIVKRPKLAISLAEKEIPIQLNARSLLGRNGKRVRRFCHRLLKEGAAAVIASDAHDPNQLDARLDETYRIVADKYGAEYANAIFWHMPRVLLGLERD
ncbi:MAG: hypothetical protein J6Z04_07360 [Clostridia bacterium]|nr:hypothetical protein [Clostridia bacterium]